MIASGGLGGTTVVRGNTYSLDLSTLAGEAPGDTGKYQYQDVCLSQLNDTFQLINTDPVVFSALGYYFRFLKLTDLELKASSSKRKRRRGGGGEKKKEEEEASISSLTTESRQYWFRTYIRPLIPKILTYFIAHGYCPYMISTVKIDCSNDEEWMKQNKEIRDKENQGYDVKMPVIYIPEYGTITHKVRLTNKTLQTEVICIPLGDEAEHLKKYNYRKTKDIHVFTSAKYNLPLFINGFLRSPMVTLLNDYKTLIQMEKFNIQACYTLSHPVAILQHKENKEDDLLSRSHSATFAESQLNQHLEQQRYYILSERDTQQAKIEKAAIESFEKTAVEEKAIYNDPVNKLAVPVRLTHAIERKFPITDGMEMTKNNPPIAVVPPGLEQLYLRWTERVGNVLSLPFSLLSKEKIGSSGSKAYADADLKILQKTVADLSVVLEDVFEEMYRILEMDDNEEFILHAQPFVDFEMMLALYEKGLMTKEQIETEIEDSYSLKRSKNSTNSSATHDMLAEMRKTESISSGEYKKGMKQIYNLEI